MGVGKAVVGGAVVVAAGVAAYFAFMANREVYIPIVSKGSQHQFWQAVKAGAEQAAKDFDVKITFEGPENETMVDKQIEMLKNALAKKPAALALAALDSKAATPLLVDAHYKKLPVIAFDSGVDSDLPVTTVSTDNEAAAQEAAKHMIELVGGKGTVGVICHDQTSQTGKQRCNGFVDYVKANAADINLLEPQVAGEVGLAANTAKEVRPCIYCYACVSEIFVNRGIKCAVNAQTGHESTAPIVPAEHAKHVLIVGGGPAGMEAARMAVLRGHRVTLVERSDRLGGTLFFAGLAYPENGRLLDYLVRQMQHPRIEVLLRTTVDAALLQRLEPDEILVATGASRAAPAIEGAQQTHVWSGDELRRLMTGDGAEEIAKAKLLSRMMLAEDEISQGDYSDYDSFATAIRDKYGL